MPRPKWATKPSELKTSTNDAGDTVVSVPIYDGNSKQGTLIWTLTNSEHRSMSVVIEQPVGADPIEFAGAWTKVINT